MHPKVSGRTVRRSGRRPRVPAPHVVQPLGEMLVSDVAQLAEDYEAVERVAERVIERLLPPADRRAV